VSIYNIRSYFLFSPIPLGGIDGLSALPEFNRESTAVVDVLVRSLSIARIKSLILSRKRDHAFSGTVIAVRKFART
jgi:hypothetical protein